MYEGGPDEPLEPLTPSPYASVIYSALRTRLKLVPSDFGIFEATVASGTEVLDKTEALPLPPFGGLPAPRRSFRPPGTGDGN
jgi:hypothetical protein